MAKWVQFGRFIVNAEQVVSVERASTTAILHTVAPEGKIVIGQDDAQSVWDYFVNLAEAVTPMKPAAPKGKARIVGDRR